MASVEFKFGFKLLNADTEDQIKELGDEAYERMNRVYQRVFGKDTELRDHYAKNRASLYSKLRAQSKQPTSQFSEGILKRYREAWNRKYSNIRKQMPKNVPNWEQRKRAQQAKGRMNNYSPPKRVTSYTTGLYSGYLQYTLDYAFKRGGSGMVSVGNLLLMGRYEVDIDAYPHASGGSTPYPLKFIEYLEKTGVVDGVEDFFTLEDQDIAQIAAFVQNIVENDLIPGFKKELEDIDKEM